MQAFRFLFLLLFLFILFFWLGLCGRWVGDGGRWSPCYPTIFGIHDFPLVTYLSYKELLVLLLHCYWYWIHNLSFLVWSSKNCPSFKKLFPEYVEKYNKQKSRASAISQQPPEDKSGHLSAKAEQTGTQDLKESVNDAGKRRQGKQLPFWIVLLLLSIFGIVIALPLMQLWMVARKRNKFHITGYKLLYLCAVDFCIV